MGYLFNALPLSPSSIIWYWHHLKLGSKLVHLCESPAPSPQILQLGWHQAEGLVGDQRPVTFFLEKTNKTLYFFIGFREIRVVLGLNLVQGCPVPSRYLIL